MDLHFILIMIFRVLHLEKSTTLNVIRFPMASEKQQASTAHEPAGKPPSAAGDDAVLSDCFSFDFRQHTEIRDPSKIEGLKDVAALVNNGDLDQALSILERNEETYADFEFIYAWKAQIYQKKEAVDQAGAILDAGLETARTRHLICARLGFLEAGKGSIDIAVKWWIRSICLMHADGRAVIWEPFLYLGHVARSIGLEKESCALVDAANMVCRQGDLELEPEAADQLTRLSGSLKTSWVPAAIRRLYHTCLSGDLSPEQQIDPAGESPADPIPDSNASIKGTRKGRQHKAGKRRMVIPAVAAAAVLALMLYFFLPENDHQQASPDTSRQQIIHEPAAEPSPPPLPLASPLVEAPAPVPPQKPELQNRLDEQAPAPAPVQPEPPSLVPPPVRKTPDSLTSKTRPSYIKHKTKQSDIRLKRKKKE